VWPEGGIRVLQGFSPQAFQFFRDLEANNTREFWMAHRSDFESLVREPLESVLAALPQPYDGFRAFRMNRDVRFSKDKSPYKTTHAAVGEDRGVARYIQVGRDGVMVAAGAYVLAPDQLDRFRRAVDAPATGQDLERILDDIAIHGVEVSHGGAVPLTTAPRGYDQSHPRIALLRQKGVAVMARLVPPECEDGEAIVAAATGLYDTAEPLVAWLQAQVGPSSAPRRR